MAGAPKGSRNNPKGRPKSVPNKITQDVREVLKGIITDLAPTVMQKLKEIENPKDYILAYAKIAEFVVPKISMIQADPENAAPYEKTTFVP